MHQVLHVAILATTLLGAAGLLLLVLWPLVGDTALPGSTRNVLFTLVGLGVVLLIVEWRFVH